MLKETPIKMRAFKAYTVFIHYTDKLYLSPLYFAMIGARLGDGSNPSIAESVVSPEATIFI